MELSENKDSIEILVNKSKELLNYQLTCYDTYFTKAGILISISSLFTPISFSFFEKFNENIMWTIIFFIPILVNLRGLYFLIQVIKPKKLNFGIGFNKFDDLLADTKQNAQLFEIGANRSSYIDNEPIISKQSEYLKKGLTLIFRSVILMTVVILIKYLNDKICICYG